MKFDAIIVGSGQAGIPLALALVELGWNVALAEKSFLGGTCINTGCSPTKTMVHRAQIAFYARNAARWGVRASAVSVNLPAIVAQKDAVVHLFRSGKQKQIAANPKLRFFEGHARFTGPHTLRVGETVLESDKIFINTGARPAIPVVQGLDTVPYLTNESIMELREAPEHLLILGGGYIGLEFGQMFARFGSKVTIMQRGDQIAPREDSEIAGALHTALEAEGITILTECEVLRVDTSGNAVCAFINQSGVESQVSGSKLLIATGRIPNSDDLGLDRAGIATDESGSIKVNSRLETNVPGVWALGDVNGGPAFTHIAYNDYQIVLANVSEGASRTTAGRLVPYCIFTDPQLGAVGMTEKAARAAGYKLKIGRYPMTSVARAIERDETAGLMKLVVNAADDRILGAAILASEGGELVQILYTLMLGNLPYTLLKDAVYIHPTLAEGFFGLMASVAPVD